MTKETINTGWLNQQDGTKFAPKTITSQIFDNNGNTIEDRIGSLEGQNRYLSINVNSTAISPDSNEDTLIINAGSGIDISADDSTDTIVISAKIDSELSTTSENLVNNKTITTELDKKPGKNVAGTIYTIEDAEVTAREGAEIFNEYTNNKAIGFYSHAEGYLTIAKGDYSHTEGILSSASGLASHAEGTATKAQGNHSHAEGNGSIASGEASHVQGKFNIIDSENTYAHIIGNGTSDDDRSNAHTVDWSGNAWYAGDMNFKGRMLGELNQVYGTALPTIAETDQEANEGRIFFLIASSST